MDRHLGGVGAGDEVGRAEQVELLGLIGGVILILYGIIPTLQPATFNFGRVYAAYGGVFVVLSLL